MKTMRILSFLLALTLMLALIAGCSPKPAPAPSTPPASEKPVDNAGGSDKGTDPKETSELTAPVDVRIAALRGPTAMGMVKMLEDNAAGEKGDRYQATVYGTADEVAALLINNQVDVAAVPANLASILYNKTEGKIRVLAINTLGVIYIVERGDSVQSIADLKGKTIYSTGQGTTPEFALNYILKQNGIDPAKDLTIEYKSEATEIASLLQSDTDNVVALLPQPFVSTVQMQNQDVRIALNLTEEWDKVSKDSTLVTGVFVAREEFLTSHPEAVAQLLDNYRASVAYVNANTKEAAQMIEKLDIVKAAVAEKALPYCNITFVEGAEMQTLLSGYLNVLFAADPKSVGGKLPDEAFYFDFKS